MIAVFEWDRRRAYTVINPGATWPTYVLVPKRAPTRHELEQQLDALAREYGVTKNKKVLEQIARIVRAVAGVEKNVGPLPPAARSTPGRAARHAI
jgi:hypothetical protein